MGDGARKLTTAGDEVLSLMEQLRADNWCVVLKCLPLDMAWIIEGSRSEYDATCPDRQVGQNKWVCEAQDMVWRNGKRLTWRHNQVAFHDTAAGAVRKVFEAIRNADDRA